MTRPLKRKEPVPRRVEISCLLGRQLKKPLVVLVEKAQPGFVAHSSGVPVFGYGDSAVEALLALTEGIESICLDDGFLDVRTVIQRTLLLENLGEERDAGSRRAGKKSSL